MRGLAAAALAFAAACSFDGTVPSSSSSPAEGTLDADVIGRGDADISDTVAGKSDGAPDGAQPMWSVVETILVDTGDSQPTFSQMTLDLDVEYRLRVSGTITNVIDAFEGDADYFDFDNPRDNGCCEDIGLGIDDFVVDDMDTQPDWGRTMPRTFTKFHGLAMARLSVPSFKTHTTAITLVVSR